MAWGKWIVTKTYSSGNDIFPTEMETQMPESPGTQKKSILWIIVLQNDILLSRGETQMKIHIENYKTKKLKLLPINGIVVDRNDT